MNAIETIKSKLENLEYSLSENRAFMNDREKAGYIYAIKILREVIKELQDNETKQ